MLFNTVSYLLFLFLSVLAYWLMPAAYRRWLILGASLFFYASWRIEFVFLVCFSAFVDYWFSLKIYDAKHPVKRKLFLASSLSINIGLLLYFKYTYFILNNIEAAGGLIGRDWKLAVGNIILPLGISFYTFLSISYTIDVYRRLFDPTRNFGVYLTYVLFWPHMIAGPILRAHELIPQIERTHHFNADHMAEGLRKILLGLFVKVALADQLSPLVDDAFSIAPSKLGGLDVWTMAFSFGFQIYFDFAGYSLIAIGSARLLGIHFPENFDWPYLAVSPRDFWKRWHITLSSWIRDYLYLPLGMQRFRDSSEGGINVDADRAGKRLRLTVALLLAWFIMGLWHGANWKFAFWGLWHACLILAYRICKDRFLFISGAWRSVAGWCITLPLVMLGWLPFRADSLEHSLQYMARVLDISSYGGVGFRESFYLLAFMIMAGMLVTRNFLKIYENAVIPAWMRYAGETALFGVVIFVDFIFLRPVNQFIYFQF